MSLNIVVCVKRVPDLSGMEIKVDESKKRVAEDNLVFDINEWDEYALEEAVLLKEKFGGRVTAVTVGSREADEVLWKCIARGVDSAVRIDPNNIYLDAYLTARVISRFLSNYEFDLVLTGAQAGDDGYAQVGPVLAELLRIPYATMVKKLELINEREIRVHRELEENYEEVLTLELPALCTIQSGINEPKYVSISKIWRARKKKIDVFKVSELGFKEEELEPWIRIEELHEPKAERETVFIDGDPSSVAKRIVDILEERGLI